MHAERDGGHPPKQARREATQSKDTLQKIDFAGLTACTIFRLAWVAAAV